MFGWPVAIDRSGSVDEPGVKDSPEEFFGGTVYQTLSEAGIEHGEVTDLAGAGIAILSFQDPDDINVELTAPLG